FAAEPAAEPAGVLPPLALQYADYAIWQQQWRAGEALASELAFWTAELDGAPQVLALPADRPRLAEQSYRGGSRSFALPAALRDALDALGRGEGATLPMVVMAGFALLLHRYSGQRDLLIGAPTAGRTAVEVERLIGCFVNTLVVRSELPPGASFRDQLRRIRDRMLAAYAHQELPFERLVDALHSERSLAYSPLIQVTLTFQNAPAPAVHLPDLTVRPVEVDTTVSKFDLSLYITEQDGGLCGAFNYNGDLFDDATIARMAAHFETLLAAIVEAPDRGAAELSIMTAAERDRLLIANNQTIAAYPRTTCLHALIEAQAARTPDAESVVFGTSRLTYRELDERANQLAHALRGLGVRPEVPVGLCLERSLELVVAMLGILKAGGAYVPLDPAYPVERLAFMMHDAGVAVLVTDERLADELPVEGVVVICVDGEPRELASQPRHAPHTAVGADNLAYVIYTSGSTGRPKGVMVSHRAAVNHMVWMHRRWPLGPGDTVLHKTPVTFDASVWEIWAPLLGGARLVMAEPGRHADPGYLVNQVIQHEVTDLQLVPSVLALVAEEPALAQCTSLRRLYAGGEALRRSLVERVHARLAVELINLYGPTEATIQAVVAVVEPADAGAAVPIGRPIDNMRAYVLDDELAPVATGALGELYLAGDGLARGYAHRPELTSARFVPDPFSAEPGGRLYRTGDLCRWRDDGALEYLGRRDGQVKLHGLRIELGEIEAVLTQAPGVKECCVDLRDGASGDRRLIAYVVTHGALDRDALSGFLRDRLPHYMVPSLFVALDALPLTAHGKLDRRALPAPVLGADQDSTASTVALPRDALEEQLVRVWEEVLDISPIGITSNFFFDLGGHSLLAVRLMVAIRNATGHDLPLATLLQHPTIAELALVLRSSPAPWSPLVLLRPGGSRPPVFCVHPHHGSVLCYAELARALDTDRPVYGLQASGRELGQEVAGSLEAMAATYVAEIRRVDPIGPYALVGWSFGGVVILEMARLLVAAGAEVSDLVMIDTYPPTGPAEPGDRHDRLARLGRQHGFDIRSDELRSQGLDAVLSSLLDDPSEDAQEIAALGVDQVQRLLEFHLAIDDILDRHEPSPYAGRVTYLIAEDEPAPESLGPARGWGRWIAGEDLRVTVVPGRHNELLREPSLSQVAAAIREALRSRGS
ncbi:MAG TPA: amino acid adenylation domain-containing protein, partial [Kofleriaceae bacterium]|nr:amino acid adenylation domain-containing protein [Kofleriaceae bacterium]